MHILQKCCQIVAKTASCDTEIAEHLSFNRTGKNLQFKRVRAFEIIWSIIQQSLKLRICLF